MFVFNQLGDAEPRSIMAYNQFGAAKPSLLLFVQSDQGPLNEVVLINSQWALHETYGEADSPELKAAVGVLQTSTDPIFIMRYEGSFLDAVLQACAPGSIFPYASDMRECASTLEDVLSKFP